MLQNENQHLKQKTETLDKKVDSLVKFLENERRLRHELENTVKEKESIQQELVMKANILRSEAESFESRETKLKR